MADTVSMALAELVRKAELNGDVDFLRDGVRVLSQALMEVEVSQHLGAERHERTAERVGQRNGYRDREWDTRVGTLGLRVPRVRDGSYFPALLEPRKRAEQALVAVVREAYVHGVSTRKVDGLVQALGLDGISKSQVSRLCETLDAEVERFRHRHSKESILTSGWTRPLSRSGTVGESSRWRSCSRSGCGRVASGKCSGWMLGRARTARSGTSSCAPWSLAASPGSSWSSAMPIRA